MTINYVANTAGYLDITFGPKWDYIPLTRVYVENFLTVNMTGRLDTHRVEMAASELLENAVKYSDKDGIRMIIDKSADATKIRLSVFNFLTKEQYEKIESRIKEMNKHDPFEYYIYRMKESIKNKKKSAGLGLARIYHEAGASVSAEYIEEEGVVAMRAIFDVTMDSNSDTEE